MSANGGSRRTSHPNSTAAPVWVALLNAPRDEWHVPTGDRNELRTMHKWESRGWIEMRRSRGGGPMEVRLTLNGRVWVRQWLGDDA